MKALDLVRKARQAVSEIVSAAPAAPVGGITAEGRQKGREALQQKADERAEELYPQIKALRDKGTPWTKIAEILNDHGKATPSGRGRWHSRTVRRIVERVEG